MSDTIMLVLGTIFGIIASAMAYLITYEEYRKHQFPKQRLIKTSLQSALFTFLFFLILSLILGYVFSNNLN